MVRIKTEATRVLVMSIVLCTAGGMFARVVSGQNTQLLGTARAVSIQSDVVFKKDQKYNSAPIPISSIYRSGLLREFREASSNPDLIIKFHKDVFLIGQETVSLTVFDAEDNSVIFTEERKLVDEENDVSRLVNHFLAKVRTERSALRDELAATRRHERAERDARDAEIIANANRARAERDAKAKIDAKIVVSIYSTSDSLANDIVEASRMLPNDNHLFLQEVGDEQDADVVLTKTIRKGISRLTLLSRDTRQILHSEVISGESVERAVQSTAKWIMSTPWEWIR